MGERMRRGETEYLLERVCQCERDKIRERERILLSLVDEGNEENKCGGVLCDYN